MWITIRELTAIGVTSSTANTSKLSDSAFAIIIEPSRILQPSLNSADDIPHDIRTPDPTPQPPSHIIIHTTSKPLNIVTSHLGVTNLQLRFASEKLGRRE